jgi:hypothetical protein
MFGRGNYKLHGILTQFFDIQMFLSERHSNGFSFSFRIVNNMVVLVRDDFASRDGVLWLAAAHYKNNRCM